MPRDITAHAPVDVALLLDVELLRKERDWLLDVLERNPTDLGEGLVNLVDHILDDAEGHLPNTTVTNISAAVDARLMALLREHPGQSFNYRDALAAALEGFEANAREYEKADNQQLADNQLSKADECRRRLAALDTPPPTGDDIPF